jgi:hypothetical protein
MWCVWCGVCCGAVLNSAILQYGILRLVLLCYGVEWSVDVLKCNALRFIHLPRCKMQCLHTTYSFASSYTSKSTNRSSHSYAPSSLFPLPILSLPSTFLSLSSPSSLFPHLPLFSSLFPHLPLSFLSFSSPSSLFPLFFLSTILFPVERVRRCEGH